MGVVVAVTPMADGRTGRVHLITDTDAAAGRARGGRYIAGCGAVVVAAALTTPDGESCRSCASWARIRGL
ncbi:MAG: hypothetical protein ACRDRT_05880 [Pseudonocardiaceae bacterium]